MSFPARIQRVDRPARGALALSLSAAGERFVLLASCRAEAAGAAIAHDRPRGAHADGFTTMLRRKVVGARVIEVRGDGGTTEVVLEAEEGRLRLVLAPGGPEGAIALYDDAGKARLSAGRIGEAPRELPTIPLEALRARGESLARSLSGAEEATRRAALRLGIGRARKQLARKLAAIEADASRAELAPSLRADASALLACLHAIPRGAKSHEVVDYATDPPATRSVAIDPALGPKAHAEALFKKARRLERGAKIAADRAAITRAALDAIERLARAADEAEAAEDLDAIEAEAAAVGVNLEHGAPSRRQAPASRRPFRTFVSSDGRSILVGRSAEDNDELTLRTARPHDLWLHARGAAGSHVVVPLEREEACPPATLAEAAMLAGHFSRFRDDRDVEVLYTPRRYVRKRRGSPAGSVSVEREKVLLVSMDRERLSRLLERERR